MQRLANGTQVATLPAPAPLVGTPGYGSNGDPTVGPQASVFDADQYNRMQEELCALVAAAALPLDGADNAQVLTALQTLFVQQGNGVRQIGNRVHIGYTTTETVGVTIDTTDEGDIAFRAWVAANYEPLFAGTPATQSWVNSLFSPIAGMKSGVASAAASGTTVQNVPITFPVPFPTATTFCLAVPAQQANDGGGGVGYGYWPTSAVVPTGTSRNGFTAVFDTLTGVGSETAVNFDHTFFCSWIAWGV